MRSKIFMTILFASALLLSACEKDNNDEDALKTVTVSITQEPDICNFTEKATKKGFLNNETKPTTAETAEEIPEYTEDEETDSVFSIWADGDFLDIDEEKYPEFSDYIEYLKTLEPKALSVTASDLSEADSELLMKELPECEISYTLYDTAHSYKWSDENYHEYPEKGIFAFCMPFVTVGAENSFNEVDKFYAAFGNREDAEHNVESLQLFFKNGDDFEAVKFSDGSYTLDINYTVSEWAKSDGQLQHVADYYYEDFILGADFTLTEDDFDYTSAQTGQYKAVFTIDGERHEMMFFIDNSANTPDFLTEEQREVFNKGIELINTYFTCSYGLPEGYVESHTAEEFLNDLLGEAFTYDYALCIATGGTTHDTYLRYIDDEGNLVDCAADRGSNIMFWNNYYQLVYSDDEQVIVKNVIVYHHMDSPMVTYYEEKNYRLVNTENGWKMDVCQSYY